MLAMIFSEYKLLTFDPIRSQILDYVHPCGYNGNMRGTVHIPASSPIHHMYTWQIKYNTHGQAFSTFCVAKKKKPWLYKSFQDTCIDLDLSSVFGSFKGYMSGL